MDEISRGYLEHLANQPLHLLIFVLVVSVLVVLALAIRSFVRDRRRRTPFSRILFRRLCRDNGLTPAEARALARMAELQQLPDPVHLLVRRSVFESAVPVLQLDPARESALRSKLYSP